MEDLVVSEPWTRDPVGLPPSAVLNEILLLDHGDVALAEIGKEAPLERALNEVIAGSTAAPLVHPRLGCFDELTVTA